jgi:anaerobic ribonucleoside-triphosphate reductase activating protein
MKYLRITSPDICNGEGVRVTLWLPGCGHKCEGCHNQWTWDYNQGKELDKEKLWNELDKSYIDGLTISGGDPLMQSYEVLDELENLLKEFRVRYGDSKNIWVYTGYYFNELNDKQLSILNNLCDVVIDGPFILSERDITLPYRGSKNQNIIKLRKEL